jgi:hypothetical protein
MSSGLKPIGVGARQNLKVSAFFAQPTMASNESHRNPSRIEFDILGCGVELTVAAHLRLRYAEALYLDDKNAVLMREVGLAPNVP